MEKIRIKTGSLSAAKAALQNPVLTDAEKIKIAAKVINSVFADLDPDRYFHRNTKKTKQSAQKQVQSDLYEIDCDVAEKNTIFELAYDVVMREVDSVFRFITKNYVLPARKDPEDIREQMKDDFFWNILPYWNSDLGAKLSTYTKANLQYHIHRLNHSEDLVHYSEEYVSLGHKVVRYISDHDFEPEAIESHMDEICEALKTTPKKVRLAWEFEAYEYHSSMSSENFSEQHITANVGNGWSTTFTIENPFSTGLTNDLILSELRDFFQEWLLNAGKLIDVDTCIFVINKFLGITTESCFKNEIVKELKKQNIPQAKTKVDTILKMWEQMEKPFAERCLEKNIIGH